MNVGRTLIFRTGAWLVHLVCLSSCMSAGSRFPAGVVVEPFRELKSAKSKSSGLRVYDRSCEADAQIDPGCALGSLPVFELPRCDGIDRAAMPVLELPPDLDPYECSVEVRSMGDVPITFDPSWRSTCIVRADGSHECKGVHAFAMLSQQQELEPPRGVQGVLTLRCSGFADEARPLVMSNRSPSADVYSWPTCER